VRAAEGNEATGDEDIAKLPFATDYFTVISRYRDNDRRNRCIGISRYRECWLECAIIRCAFRYEIA